MGTTVGLRVPAVPEQLTILRALSETVTMLADFDLGEVNDIRLALDEVAMVLIRDAAPGSTLDCDLTYDEDELTVRVSAITSSEGALEDRGLSWHIVRSLTDSLDATQGAYARAAAGFPTVVEFRRHRDAQQRSRG
ncbi:ATP-binding protein [Nocardia sp. NBC_01327]|uniref:ATP-binding protein n=1 Tax=Nocardia sp. NBC_01327 TaxID=2903593 RepID=UPI002E159943|nr:ATP-binding protein [Nocardia sp. NBC_01327]